MGTMGGVGGGLMAPTRANTPPLNGLNGGGLGGLQQQQPSANALSGLDPAAAGSMLASMVQAGVYTRPLCTST
jgi:hypothetical protein